MLWLLLKKERRKKMEKLMDKKSALRVNEKDLKGKVVVITGANAGVGRTTAWEFAKEGAQLALLARGHEALEATKREVEDLGGKAIIYSLDVANPTEIENAADFIERELGPIDIWINNAMTSVFSPVKEMKPEEYKRVTEVTYLGQVYGTLAALKRMQPRDKGKIIFIGSTVAYRGIPLQSAYCGAKHAILGFYDSLRTELIHDKSKVKISLIELPSLNTSKFNWIKSRLPYKHKPLGTVFEPEVAARSIVFAAKNNRREMFVGFPTVRTIIGNRLAPGIADNILAKKGYEGQQTNEPEDPNRMDNLWEPVPGPHSAYGPFHDKAYSKSPQLWLSMNRGIIAASIAAAGLGAGIAYLTTKRSRMFERTRDKINSTINC
jgi:short-subunit dehydrogenase